MTEPKLRIRASGFNGSGYSIPRDDGTVLKVPGLTTVLGALPKGGVVQWAVDNTVLYMLANLDHILTYYDEDILFRRYRFYHQRKPKVDDPDVDPFNAHVGVLEDAAETGTFTHDWIESFILEEELEEFVKDEQFEAVDAFLDWQQHHVIEPLYVETTVVDETLGWAGTFDHIWDVQCLHDEPCHPDSGERPVRMLVDVKTSRAVYESHVAQVAALRRAEYLLRESHEDDLDAMPHKIGKKTTWWVREEMPEVEAVAILQTRFDDWDKDGNEVPRFCRLHIIPEAQLEVGYELFLASLQMKKAEKKWKDLTK